MRAVGSAKAGITFAINEFGPLRLLPVEFLQHRLQLALAWQVFLPRPAKDYYRIPPSQIIELGLPVQL